MSAVIPHNLPSLGREERAAADRVVASGWIAQGREVQAFEDELGDFLGLSTGHVVMVSSGSAALYLALWVLQGKGRRIGLPVYSCTALRNAVGLIEGHPCYLDCAPDSPNLDAGAAAIRDVDILIAPSIFGIPTTLPDEPSCKVVEDLAQALGASVGGARIGLRGDVGICSFYATKMITSGGQGGAVVSRDKGLIDALRDYRDFDCRMDTRLRFNFQMTDLQAAIGRVQLGKLPGFIARRQQIFSTYQQAGLQLMSGGAFDGGAVRYRAIVRASQPEHAIERLGRAGVRAIVPVETGELLDTPDIYPAATALTRTTLSLPIHPSLTDNQVRCVVQAMGDPA